MSVKQMMRKAGGVAVRHSAPAPIHAPMYNVGSMPGEGGPIPSLPLHPQTIGAIRRAPKGKLPPALEKYLAAHKKKKPYDFAAAEKRLGIVSK